MIKSGECEITYLYNSGFLIETAVSVMVIDYYKYDKGLNLDKYNSKKIYFLATHNHKDHFNPEIFDFKNPNISLYILQKDIPFNKKDNVMLVSKYNKYEISDNIEVETFGSTDRGVSFSINVDGLSIFHSGDLNWWKWKNDSAIEQKKEENDYKKEIEKIKDINFDISFVPVDPRLEEYYALGVKHFAQNINTKTIIPMHFRDKINPVKKLKDKWEILGYKTDFVFLKNPGEKFLYKKD